MKKRDIKLVTLIFVCIYYIVLPYSTCTLPISIAGADMLHQNEYPLPYF